MGDEKAAPGRKGFLGRALRDDVLVGAGRSAAVTGAASDRGLGATSQAHSQQGKESGSESDLLQEKLLCKKWVGGRFQTFLPQSA